MQEKYHNLLQFRWLCDVKWVSPSSMLCMWYNITHSVSSVFFVRDICFFRDEPKPKPKSNPKPIDVDSIPDVIHPTFESLDTLCGLKMLDWIVRRQRRCTIAWIWTVMNWSTTTTSGARYARLSFSSPPNLCSHYLFGFLCRIALESLGENVTEKEVQI